MITSGELGADALDQRWQSHAWPLSLGGGDRAERSEMILGTWTDNWTRLIRGCSWGGVRSNEKRLRRRSRVTPSVDVVEYLSSKIVGCRALSRHVSCDYVRTS